MMGTVEFYENVNRLQEVIEASEDRRLDLNRQFISALKSDVIKDKRNIAQLQSYWKQICDNETRSRDRNAKLLDDIDRIERNMGALARKTERLRNMKKHYEEYVERLYPDWREQFQAQMSQKASAERVTSPVQAHPVRDAPSRAFATPPAVMDSRARSVNSPMHALRLSEGTESGPTEVPPLQLSALRSSSSSERKTLDFPTMLTTSTAAQGDIGSALPLTGKSDVTAVTPFTGKNSMDSKREQRVSFDMNTLKKTWDSDEDEDEVEFEIPVINSRESTPKTRELMKVEVQNHTPPASVNTTSNGIAPSSSPVLSSQDLRLSVGRAESTGPFDPPKLTMSGLFHLLQFLEEEIKSLHSSRQKPMLYRSSTPKESVSDEVISFGNAGRDPSHLDTVSVSMAVVDQLPPITAALPDGYLLSDVIIMDFVNNVEKLDEDYIMSRMPDTKLSLWKRLMTHFKALVFYQIMTPQEVSELFAVCLIHYNSRVEAKAIELFASLLEDCAVADSLTEDSVSMVTPRASYIPSVSIARRDPNPLQDSLMATAGSFQDTTPLKVITNPDLRSTESDQQLVFLRNALRAKAESDEGDDEDGEDDDLGTGHWKRNAKKEEMEEEEEDEDEFEALGAASSKPFISASVQPNVMSSSLKDSDAYLKMLGKGASRKLSTNSSDDDDLDLMLSGPGTRTSLPAVREVDLSDERNDTGRSSQNSKLSSNEPISTQKLLQAVISKDHDDLDIESPASTWKTAQSKPKENVVDIDDYDDDFDEFYK